MFLNLILSFSVYLIGFVFNRQGNLKNIVDKITEKIGEKNLKDIVTEKVETENVPLPTLFTLDKITGNILGAGFLRIFLGLFFLILLVSPSCIKRSINESGIAAGTDYLLEQLSKKVESVEIKDVIKLVVKANSVEKAKSELEEAKNKINDPQAKNEIESKIENLNDLEDGIKKQIAATTPSEIKKSESWVYLGKSEADKQSWNKAETIKENIKIRDLTENSVITFTDAVYLRTGNCPHGQGDIVGAVLANSKATIIGSLDFCTIEGTDKFGVWAKVKTN